MFKVNRNVVIFSCGLLGAIGATVTLLATFDNPIERIRLGFDTSAAAAAAITGYLAIVGGATIGMDAAHDVLQYVKEQKHMMESAKM